ncbi:MAG TPA: universal stress protein [Candidatus Nitrosotenuis sp.]|jgi:nucleotide-binding universal stress UspA family protein|nr:universal stress protein [Candidatus Nitrosotenuis sp.]HIH45757.1 universal stress protein [Candidatus Nitrosotenuis sp.]HII03556.1 universal stress protein [Candidatus Nitrosotenuis sp.]
MYRRILVPFDGSKYSKKSLDHAIEMARIRHGVIYLCTIINANPIVPPGSLLGLVKTSSRNEFRKKIFLATKMEAEKMRREQIQYCKTKGIDIHYKIINNDNIVEQILKIAKKKSIDIIVIGSQGLQGIGKIRTLGSISRKVSELAHCPVLIIR